MQMRYLNPGRGPQALLGEVLAGRSTHCSHCCPFYFDSFPVPIRTGFGPAMALHPTMQSLDPRPALQHGAQKWILVCLPAFDTAVHFLGELDPSFYSDPR